MKKQKFTDFFTAWWWLYYHPLFLDYEAIERDKDYLNRSTLPWTAKTVCEFYSRMGDYVDISPHRVNPKTRMIDDDDSKNTHIEIWLEAGYKWIDNIPEIDPTKNSYVFYHDLHLDCYEDTYESAITTLANLVWKRYGTGKKFMNEKLKDLGVKLKESK